MTTFDMPSIRLKKNQEHHTEHFAGVGVQSEDGHGERDGERDVVFGVFECGTFRQDQVDPHGLHVWRRAGQLRDQQTLETLRNLDEQLRDIPSDLCDMCDYDL